MADNIQVAVRVRPLDSNERKRGCVQVLRKITGEPQLIVNNVNQFTFNHVFMPETQQEVVYDATIKDLIRRLFEGFNCTVLAYGQTGSGKTYTMGTNYAGDAAPGVGIIPRAIAEIYQRIEEDADITATITCSFMELYQEELYDLLATNRRSLEIREMNNNVVVPGLTEVPVQSPAETVDCLVTGSGRRATGSTAMNEHSSRSHAIFTISLKIVNGQTAGSAITSKFHLVDLAGSERVNKTKATGERFREGVKINQGLLSLGNVISALGTGQKTASFRESKLTRLLQNSLGGNSVTLMIACVSPADYNLDESLSTLRYADRAKQIKNKAVVNRDPHSQEIARLNDIILKLRNQLATGGQSIDASVRGGLVPGLGATNGIAAASVMDADMRRQNEKLITDLTNVNLQIHYFEMMRDTCSELMDQLASKVNIMDECIRLERPREEITAALNGVKELVEEIHRTWLAQAEDTEYHDVASHDSMTETEAGLELLSTNKVFTEDMKRLKDELVMKQHLAKKLMDNLIPEAESQAMISKFSTTIATLEREKDELQQKIRSKPNVTAKLAEERRRKITLLERDIDAMRKKILNQEKLIVLHKNTEKNLQSLQTEIMALKHQKVQLVKNMRTEQDKFRQQKLKSEKEINVLKEKDKKRLHEMRKLEVQHQKQRNYMQRKVEEANMKAKRAENLLKKQSNRVKTTGQMVRGPEQVAVRLNQELEIVYFISEVQASLTHLMEARTELNRRLEQLDGNREDYEAQKGLLEDEIRERTYEINDLQQKIQTYDFAAKVDAISKEVQSEDAVKILITQIGDLRREYYEEKLRMDATAHMMQDRVEQLELDGDQKDLDMLRAQKEYEEKMSILLQNGRSGNGFIAGTDRLKPIMDDLLAQIETLREENEKLKATSMRPPKKPVVDRRLQKLQQQRDDDVLVTDGESEPEVYDTDDDPDWSFSEELNGRKNLSKEEETVQNQSVGSCHCKSDCSKRICGCRKNSRYCSDRCRCTGCVNKCATSTDNGEEDDDDDQIEGARATKKMRLTTDENVDTNNTFIQYPYSETKPVFYERNGV